MTIHISKIFVGIGESYLFSEKIKLWSSNDHLLELLGGHLENSETPFQGLIRELQEEDSSGILASKVNSLKPLPREIVINDEKHSIYKIEIKRGEFKSLKHNPSESYGFHLIEKSILDDNKSLKKNISKFTQKTRKIFTQLSLL